MNRYNLLGGRKIKNRQLEIVLYLNEIKKTTITKLAEKFEVSKRTIMRDIDAISALGVPIYTQPGYQGGVSIPDTYKFQQSFFTPKEIEDLILALHIIGQLRRMDTKNSILKKLELLVPELAYLKENDFFEYLKVELLEEPFLKNNPVSQKINTALDEERCLRIEINKQEFYVAPLSYALRPTGLYLYATNGSRKMTFPLSDIVQCEVTKEEFNREDYSYFLYS